MSELEQFPGGPIQQFPTDSTVFEVRQNHEDLNLPRFTYAEAITDDIFFKGADVSRKRSRTDVLSPRFRSDADGTQLFFRERVFPRLAAQRYALGGVSW